MAIDYESLGLEEIESLRREIKERTARNRERLLKAAHARQAEYDALAPTYEKALKSREKAAVRLVEMREKVDYLAGVMPHASLLEDEEKITALRAEYTSLVNEEIPEAEAALFEAEGALAAATYDELEETKALEEDLSPLVSSAGGNHFVLPSEWPEEALEIANRLFRPAHSRRKRLESEIQAEAFKKRRAS